MQDLPEYELLSAYLDGEATPQERAEVEKLLASDPAARALLDELQAIRESIQNLPPVHLREDLSQRVLQLAERQMLLEQSPAARSDARPVPGSVARSIARRVLQPRALIRTALILLVAAGLYVFEVRQQARPARQVAVAPSAERSAGLAQAPQLHSIELGRPSVATGSSGPAAGLPSSAAISLAGKQPAAPGVVRAEPARKAMPTAGEFESTAATAAPASPAPPSPQPLTPSSIVKKDEQGIGGEPNDGRKPATAMSTMPGLPSSYGTRLAVTAGERDKGVDFGGRAAESRSASSHGGVAGGETGTSLFRGAVSGPVRGEQEQEKAAASGKFKRSGDGQLSLDQDVLLVKLVVAPQALARHVLERLLDEQQIVASVANREPTQSQYVGDAAPEKLAALLKELRLRKTDFPFVVEGSQAANRVLNGAIVNDRAATEVPRPSGENRLDNLDQQRQNARPVIQQQAETQLRAAAPAEDAKAVLEGRRVRFVLQVTPADVSASSPPAAATPAAKPAVHVNPLRRAAGPSSNTDRPQ